MNYLKLVNQTRIAADKKNKTNDWVGIIIHHTDIGGRKVIDDSLWKKLMDGIAGWLTKADENYVSAHFQVGRFGEIYMLVDPKTHVAYHAGISSWFHPILRKVVTGWNAYSIGIEVLGDGNLHRYSEEQYLAIGALCKALLADFPTIDPRCITGHENIAPDRKTDPGKFFEWTKLFKLIFK